MLSENNYSLSDIAAVNGGNGFGGTNGGWFWIVILFLFAFAGGGWGNGFMGNGGGGAAENYVLASDFATLQRQLSDGFGAMERKGDSISNGLCDGFYAMNTTALNGFAGVNQNVANGFANAELSRANQQSALMAQLNAMAMQNQQCCCDNRAAVADLKYTVATTGNATDRAVEQGFCQTNYNNANNARDIIDNQNANARAILDALNRQSIEAKDSKIAEQNQQIFALQLAASQSKQNELLIDRLGYHCPQPAYVVQPPQNVTFPTNCCGGVNYAAFNGGCGCNG